MVVSLGRPTLATGFEAPIPYQVSLVDVQTYSHFCGGAILNSFFILTAYHCMYRSARWPEDPKFRYPLDIKDIRVIAGSRTLQFLEHSAQVRTVEEFFPFPAYNQSTFDNDLFLLQLATPLRMTPFVNYVPLPLMGRGFIGNISISGWGVVGIYPNGVTVSPVVSRSGKLGIISNHECNLIYKDFVTRTMLCGQGIHVATCPGDSGSPGVCWDEISGQSVLCGVVSWSGKSECYLNYDGTLASAPEPTVFTKVSIFMDWISFRIRNANISADYWMCDDLQFIRGEGRCNKGIDCEDESDEFDCDRKTTTELPIIPAIPMLHNEVIPVQNSAPTNSSQEAVV